MAVQTPPPPRYGKPRPDTPDHGRARHPAPGRRCQYPRHPALFHRTQWVLFHRTQWVLRRMPQPRVLVRRSGPRLHRHRPLHRHQARAYGASAEPSSRHRGQRFWRTLARCRRGRSRPAGDRKRCPRAPRPWQAEFWFPAISVGSTARLAVGLAGVHSRHSWRKSLPKACQHAPCHRVPVTGFLEVPTTKVHGVPTMELSSRRSTSGFNHEYCEPSRNSVGAV